MRCSHFLLLATQRVAVILLAVSLLPTPRLVWAHGGHGNEFQAGSPATGSPGSIQVDKETAKRLGLKVEAVSRQRLAFGIKATGTIETLPNQQVEVTTPVTGTVVKLLVNPGDRVKAGQPVAVMTTPELAELRTTALDRRVDAIGAVQQAEADLLLAQRNLQQQRKIVAADIQQAKSGVSFAQERADKDRSLSASGALPRRTALESETKLAEAKAALAKAASALEISQAQAQLQRARSAVTVAQSRVALSGETYQTRLRQLGASANADGSLTLTAPIAGIVAVSATTQGESGQDAGKRVMTILNHRKVQVSGNIYEKDLKRIQVNQRVRVQSSGLGSRTFNGRLSRVGAIVEGETRVVPVKAELDNPDGVLKPGLFVDLEVLTNRTPAAVLAIPKSALVKTNDQKTIVFVQNGNAFQPAEVTLGRESEEFVEVKNGLFDGDLIVTQRANQFYAQLLRGGNPAADDHGDPRAAPASNSQPAIPWWVAIPAGGTLMTGMFWAGTLWAKRRHGQAEPVPNGHSSHQIDDDLSLMGDRTYTSSASYLPPPNLSPSKPDHRPH